MTHTARHAAPAAQQPYAPYRPPAGRKWRGKRLVLILAAAVVTVAVALTGWALGQGGSSGPNQADVDACQGVANGIATSNTPFPGSGDPRYQAIETSTYYAGMNPRLKQAIADLSNVLAPTGTGYTNQAEAGRDLMTIGGICTANGVKGIN
jgi:hypothetical protein